MPAPQGGAAGCWHLQRADKKAYRTIKSMLLQLLSLIHWILKTYFLFVSNYSIDLLVYEETNHIPKYHSSLFFSQVSTHIASSKLATPPPHNVGHWYPHRTGVHVCFCTHQKHGDVLMSGKLFRIGKYPNLNRDIEISIERRILTIVKHRQQVPPEIYM